MNYTKLFLAPAILAATCCLTPNTANAQTDVIAFWDFEADYDFSDETVDGPNRLNFLASDPGFGIDNTASGNANLQAYLGNAGELDDDGGGGFSSYTSPVSGDTFEPTRTLKFDDLRGGGDDFDINGQTLFDVQSFGEPLEERDFSNDALLYFTLDATDFEDLQIRFDLEGTPGDLPTSFDIFYRTTGTGGTWFRDEGQNNFEVTFADQDPANPDLENQVASTPFISLNSALNEQGQVEIIINDFSENGNGELEIDNIEIVGNAVTSVPEPGSAGLLFIAGLGFVGLRRRNR